MPLNGEGNPHVAMDLCDLPFCWNTRSNPMLNPSCDPREPGWAEQMSEGRLDCGFFPFLRASGLIVPKQRINRNCDGQCINQERVHLCFNRVAGELRFRPLAEVHSFHPGCGRFRVEKERHEQAVVSRDALD